LHPANAKKYAHDNPAGPPPIIAILTLFETAFCLENSFDPN